MSLELMRHSACVEGEAPLQKEAAMHVVQQTCAGMDIHTKDVKVCLVTHDPQGQRQEEALT